MNEDKKVILIKGGKSRWFEQAIFILKDKDQRRDMPKNFVEEAEKIINSYMLKKYPKSSANSVYSQNTTAYPPKKLSDTSSAKSSKKKKYDKILNVSIVLSCILIGLILYYFG